MTAMSAPPLVQPASVVVSGPPSPEATDRWYRLHDLARESGLAAGLRALTEEIRASYDGPDGIMFGPAGHAIVLADPGSAEQLFAVNEQLFAVRLGDDTVLALRRREPPSGSVAASPEWAAGIGWIRLGASRWLLRYCVGHARERKIGQETLLQQQMAQGMVADALTTQLEAEALLDGGPLPGTAAPGTAVPGTAEPGGAVLSEVHSRIQVADRIALSLLGASGFQAGLPSHTVWVSELLADAYPGV